MTNETNNGTTVTPPVHNPRAVPLSTLDSEPVPKRTALRIVITAQHVTSMSGCTYGKPIGFTPEDVA